MKFRSTATIAIYFLFTILFFISYTHAAQEKKEKFLEEQKLQQNTLDQDLSQNLERLMSTDVSYKEDNLKVIFCIIKILFFYLFSKWIYYLLVMHIFRKLMCCFEITWWIYGNAWIIFLFREPEPKNLYISRTF